MKLQFVKIEKRKGEEKKEVIYQWGDVADEDVCTICQNFMDGFLYAMDNFSDYNLRRPSVMVMHGWSAQTWRWHDSDSGTLWEFQDENGKGLYRWDIRKK